MQEKRTDRIIIKRKQKKRTTDLVCVFIWSGSKSWVFHQQPDCRVVFCFASNIIFFIAKAGKRVYNNNNKVVGGKYDEQS